MNTENLTSWKCLFCLSRTFLGKLCSFVVSENNFSSLLYSSVRHVSKEPSNSFIACIFLELLANVRETTVLFHYLYRYTYFFFGGGDKESSQDKIQTVESRGWILRKYIWSGESLESEISLEGGESFENIYEVVALPPVDDNLNHNVQYI